MTHAPDHGPERLRDAIARIAPGTALRDGLERILRGRTGGLIVLGYDQVVEDLCDGGFDLDVAFAPTRLRELSKMDGAVVVSTDGSRIVRANVQLVPDPSIPTAESGTRHRAAARTAIHTGYPVISVSQSMSIVSVYVGGVRQVIEDPDALLGRANVALSTLERYRTRRDEVYTALASAEIEDYVTLRDAMTVAQRLEMVRRVAEEIDAYVIELGTSGRQLRLQLVELAGDNEHLRELLVRDYLAGPDVPSNAEVATTMTALAALSDQDLLNLPAIADVFGFPPTELAQDTPTRPRGYRMLSLVPRLQFAHIDLLVRHYRSLQALLAEPAAGLEAVDGIGPTWAGHIRECLSHLAEASIERLR